MKRQVIFSSSNMRMMSLAKTSSSILPVVSSEHTVESGVPVASSCLANGQLEAADRDGLARQNRQISLSMDGDAYYKLGRRFSISRSSLPVSAAGCVDRSKCLVR